MLLRGRYRLFPKGISERLLDQGAFRISRRFESITNDTQRICVAGGVAKHLLQPIKQPDGIPILGQTGRVELRASAMKKRRNQPVAGNTSLGTP